MSVQVSAKPADLRDSRRHAILFVLSASATFTIGSALVKSLSTDFPVLEIVMFRSIVGFLLMLPMIIRAVFRFLPASMRDFLARVRKTAA